MTTLPPIEALAQTAAMLAETAAEAGDTANTNALNKAIYHLESGLHIIPTHGGYLVPSGTRSGTVHRVSDSHGCSCEAGAAGRSCWHQACVEIIEVTRQLAAPMPTQRTSYEDACAAMNELYA